LLTVIVIGTLGYAAVEALTTAAILDLYHRWPPKHAGGAGGQERCTPYSQSFGTKVSPRWLKFPRKIRHVPPVYPQAAKEAGVHGFVIVGVTLGCSGKVIDARVVRSIPELDEAALETVRQWEYQPVVDDQGTRREIGMTVTVDFTPQP
jgi:TonB family protein